MRWKAALTALLLLMLSMGTRAEDLTVELDPYVLEPDAAFTLSDEAEDAYHALVDAALHHERSAALSDSYDDNLTALWLWQNNPYSFFTTGTRLAADHRAVTLEYAYDAREQADILSYINDEFRVLLSGLRDMSDLEKTLAVHRYFAGRISYDYAYAEALSKSDNKYLYPEKSIYEALTTGTGVCHSYAALCEFALQQLGIDCLRLKADIEGTDEVHMWLAVRLDGEWYHIDPTWDSDGEWVSLRCFGVTDEERLESGLADTWNVGVDVNFGPIHCVSRRFEALHDVYDYRLIGNHQMEVWRIGEEEPEIIDIDTL